MLEGLYCRDEFIEFDGFYWQRGKSDYKYSTKIYYRQVFFSSNPNQFGEELLHRYIYSKYCGAIPDGYIIHHVNEDELNNTIQNLTAMTRGEHNKITRQNLKNSNPEAYKSKPHSEETKKRLSEVMKGKKHSEEHIRKAVESKRKAKLDRIKSILLKENVNR